MARNGNLSPEKFTYTWNQIDVFVDKRSAGSLPKRIYHKLKDCCGIAGNASKDAAEKKQLLSNVSGFAAYGELMAIMGSSGAGKTTLLNILAFRSPPGIEISAKAERTLNGHLMSASVLRGNCAYVQQDDLFIGTLSTREHLLYQAMLRMSNTTLKAKKERVDEVLKELSLTQAQNTQIGSVGYTKGLSGGERKRLAFASEILTDPPLLICDEPTSGLDSYMAVSIVNLMRQLANKGKTILVTIHQPSSELFNLFDKLLLMSAGRVAFLGTPKQAIDFFNAQGAECPTNCNPCEFYVNVLSIAPSKEDECRRNCAKLCDAFAASDINRKIQSTIQSMRMDAKSSVRPGRGRKFTYQTSWLNQFAVLTRRSFLTSIREPMILRIKIIQSVLISLVIGWVYYQQKFNQTGIMNINGMLFLTVTNLTFQNMYAVINVFCLEISIFVRESRSKLYRTSAYFLAKSIAEMPIYLLIPLIYLAILWPMVDLNQDSWQRICIAAGVLIVVSQVATSFGYLISCASGQTEVALSVGPVVVVPFLLMGGFFLNHKTVPEPLKWIPYVSWFMYGNEALMINVWEHVRDGDIACDAPVCIPNGQLILDMYGFKKTHMKRNIFAMIALMILFRFLAWFALMLRARSKE